MDGKPLTRLADGSPAPRCALSGLAAGDMRFDPPPGGEGDSIHGPVRERFFRSLGIPPGRVYSLVQVHSRSVFPLGDPAAPGAALPPPGAFVREGDGMVSYSPRAVLAVTVADCLPVFLLDRDRGFFAVCHSGWKGTGIVLEALALLAAAGTRPEAAAAVLGPAIRGCCYRVDEERAAAFLASLDSLAPPSPAPASYPLGPPVLRDGGETRLDLQAANARLLAAAGVRHIAYCEDCTFTSPALGSFRREGSASYTRMAALAGYFENNCE